MRQFGIYLSDKDAEKIRGKVVAHLKSEGGFSDEEFKELKTYKTTDALNYILYSISELVGANITYPVFWETVDHYPSQEEIKKLVPKE